MISASMGRPAHVFFLDGSAGRIHALYHPPRDDTPMRGHVLFAPPFAEEMNKSRRMFTLQAFRLSQLGYGSLIFDLYGTGESAGGFGDARWEIWKEDMHAALSWLRETGELPISVLGLRLGALLALDALAGDDPLIERLVLWQPPVSGEIAMTQFLRLRVAAGMLGETGKAAESTSDLRTMLAGGQCIEVGGYGLSPELVRAIDGLRMESLPTGGPAPMHWFEVAPAAERDLAPASRRIVDAWRTKGIAITTEAIADIQFWSSAEIATAPRLLQRTSRLFEQGANNG